MKLLVARWCVQEKVVDEAGAVSGLSGNPPREVPVNCTVPVEGHRNGARAAADREARDEEMPLRKGEGT